MANPANLSQRVEKAAKVMKLPTEVLYAMLSKLGIDKEDEDAIELLEAETTKEGDARHIMVDTGVDEHKVKLARFAAGWAILKGRGTSKEEKTNDIAELVKSTVPIQNRSNQELIEEYAKEPSETPDQIIDELMRRSRGNPFVIYVNGKVNKSLTMDMLSKARRGKTSPRHAIRLDDIVAHYTVHRANEFPNMWVEISPLHDNVVLNDGYCEMCNDTWTGISMEDRVIVRVAKMAGFIDISNKMSIHDLIAKVRKSGAQFLLAYPEVQELYTKLKEEGRLGEVESSLRRKMTFSSSKRDPLNPNGGR